jgi:hypothetical protein
MFELLTKAFYTLILLAIAGICVREVAQVWWDKTLLYGKFAATTNGQDAPAQGDAFRRFIMQQQAVLFRLFKAGGSRPGAFRFGEREIELQNVSDLGHIPSSLLDEVKIEAGGVNVSSVLSALRRTVKPPNEVTGSIDQLGNELYVVAQWRGALQRDGSNARTIILEPQPNLESASFDLACRIFLTRVGTKHPVLREADEDDFCAFATALNDFRSYLAARDRAPSEEDRRKVAKEKLDPVQARIERLVTNKTELPYAYKLAGYVEIERQAALPSANAADLTQSLDRAEDNLRQYVERLAKLAPEGKDPDVTERLVYLAARRAKQENAKEIASSPTVGVLVETAKSLFASQPERVAAAARAAVAVATAKIKPGASISSTTQGNAGTLCCFVKDTAGKVYFVTVAHLAGKEGDEIVSPARIDAGQSRTIGTVEGISTGVALVAVAPGVDVGNELAAGPPAAVSTLAPAVQPGEEVKLIGRTSVQTGKVYAVEATVEIAPGLLASGLVLTEKISFAGDAGAPVLDANNRLVGMLIGSSDQQSVVLPLKPYLDERDLSLL